MECTQCVECLSEYLDGELPVMERRDIEEHLQGCPDCRRVMDGLAAVGKEINLSIASIPIPVNLTARILTAIEREQRNNIKDVWLTSLLLAAFASPLLLVFSRTFSRVFHLLYTIGSAFWRSAMLLATLISPWAAMMIGFLSLFLLAMGAYIIKMLLTKLDAKEVFL